MFELGKKAVLGGCLIIGLMASAPAMAATYGYELSINDPIFNSTSGDLNVPDFTLANMSDLGSGIDILGFSLTIGDVSFNYDFVRVTNILTDTGAALTPTLNTVGTANDGVGDNVLQYSFTGFNPLDVYQFEVDVDPDSGTPSQDYREALFPTAEVSVTFSNGETLSQLLNPTDTTPVGYTFDQYVTPAVVPLPAGLPLYLGALFVAGAFTARKRKED